MAYYPTNTPSTSDLHTAVNNLETALNGAIDGVQTTITVAATTGFPTVGTITIDTERISYTGISGNDFTGCTRGFGGTSAVGHADAAPVKQTYGAEYHNDLKDEVIAALTDLRDCFREELTDSTSPASTASDMRDRIDQLVTQLKNITGETDWKTVPATTLSVCDSVKAALDDSDTPASTASDIKDRLDQIVSQIKLIIGETSWYTAPDVSLATVDLELETLKQNIPNILVNGGFEVWQRGTSFSNPSSLDYTADKWQFETNGTANVTVERSAVEYEGNYAASLILNSAGTSTYLILRQDIEDPEKYRSKTITITARVRANTANAVKLAVFDSSSSSTSSYHTGGDTYELLTVTHTVNASTTVLRVRIQWDANLTATNYFLIDSAWLGHGDQPLQYVIEDSAIELQKCQRYYQKIGGGITNEYIASGTCWSATNADLPFRFPVEMTSTPTMTVIGGNNFKCLDNVAGTATTNSVSASGPHKKGFYLGLVVPAATFTIGYSTNTWTPTVNEYIEAEV